MYKFKLFSGSSLAKEVLNNAKRQAKENPITAAGFGIMSLNAINGLYNTESSRKARERTLEELKNLSPKSRNKIIIQR